MSPFSDRPTFAQINLDDLRSNFRSCRKFIGSDVKYMAVVKANAYGHGAVECSKVLIDEGVDWLGVAMLEEALQLRNAGLSIPILCLGGLFDGQEDAFLDNDVTPALFNIDQVKSLDSAAKARNVTKDIHIKIDTGMGRLGIRWHELDEFIRLLMPHPNLRVRGLMSHFASANDPNEDDFTNQQIDRFNAAIGKFEAAGFSPEVFDIANSPGAVGHPRSRQQMVRLGGILYGLGRDVLSESRPQPELRPVMSVYSEIADIKNITRGETLGYGRTFETERDSRIALVPIGYNDGYPRSLSNKSSVIVRGNPIPVRGRISMDWTIVDVTDVPDAKPGDRVTLIGEDGDNSIRAEDVARRAETISYEITCGISSRVPRRFTSVDR